MSDQEFDEDDIRGRAFEISQGRYGGSPEQNWLRAVDSLRAEREARQAVHPAPDMQPPFPPYTAALTHP